MPPKMMMETPFPIPNSVMSSPIQTSSIVPAVIVSKRGESRQDRAGLAEAKPFDQRDDHSDPFVARTSTP